MEENLKTYLEYLQQTLGVKNFILPAQEDIPESSSFKVLFYLDPTQMPLPESQDFSEDMELLKKMIEALPVDFSEVGVLQGSLSDLNTEMKEARIQGPVFCFSHDSYIFLKNNFSEGAYHELPSLSLMRQAPSYKRTAWNTLKAALKI